MLRIETVTDLSRVSGRPRPSFDDFCVFSRCYEQEC